MGTNLYAAAMAVTVIANLYLTATSYGRWRLYAYGFASALCVVGLINLTGGC